MKMDMYLFNICGCSGCTLVQGVHKSLLDHDSYVLQSEITSKYTNKSSD